MKRVMRASVVSVLILMSAAAPVEPAGIEGAVVDVPTAKPRVGGHPRGSPP